MQKTVCVKNKTSKFISRVSISAAHIWVSSGIAHYVRKGAFKRQEANLAKAARRPKTKQIYGAKIVREYKARKEQQLSAAN